MDTRFRVTMVTIFGLLAAAVWALPYWWPYLNPESVVAEGLPGLTLDERAIYAAFPNSVKNLYETLYEGDEDTEMPPQPDWAVALVQARITGEDRQAEEADTVFEPPPGSQLVYTGTFTSIDGVRQASGGFEIYQNPDGTRLLHLNEEFRSSRAPDIHLVLTRNPDPMAENIGVGIDYVDIGVLRGNVGQQNYIVPPSADFGRFPVLALYSKQYDAVLATATIR